MSTPTPLLGTIEDTHNSIMLLMLVVSPFRRVKSGPQVTEIRIFPYPAIRRHMRILFQLFRMSSPHYYPMICLQNNNNREDRRPCGNCSLSRDCLRHALPLPSRRICLILPFKWHLTRKHPFASPSALPSPLPPPPTASSAYLTDLAFRMRLNTKQRRHPFHVLLFWLLLFLFYG